jgi:hypothetical protein
MTGSTRLATVVAAGLLIAVSACAAPRPDVALQQPVTSSPAQPAHGSENATNSAASQEFCTRFGQDMTALNDGDDADRRAALTDLDALLAAAPTEFRTWAAAMSPWVRAQLGGDTQTLEQTAAPSEEASYQIANHCQFLLVD